MLEVLADSIPVLPCTTYRKVSPDNSALRLEIIPEESCMRCLVLVPKISAACAESTPVDVCTPPTTSTVLCEFSGSELRVDRLSNISKLPFWCL